MGVPCRRVDGRRGPRPSVPLLLIATAALTAGAACSGGSGGDEPVQLEGRVSTGPLPTGPSVVGVKWDWNRIDRYGPYLERFTGGDTFYELVWCEVEREEGSRDWSRVDEAVHSASRFGFRMHLKIRVGSCWTTARRLDGRGERGKTASLPPSDVEAYREFVRAVVTRYAPLGVHRYAIENEVNLSAFWQASPSDYERLARIAAPVIREVDSAAVVLDGGLSSTASGVGIARWLLNQDRGEAALAAYSRYYGRRFQKGGSQMPEVDDIPELEEALGQGQPQQNLRFLDATFRLARDGVIDAYQLHFYEQWDNVPLLLQFLRGQLPAGLPIEAWETGIFYPRVGDDIGLAGETAKVTALLMAGGVRPVIWLPAAPDIARGAEVRWGLFDPQARPRLAADVFLDLARMAAGSIAQPVSSDNQEGVAFTREGETYMILWSDDRTPLAGQPPPGTRARRVDGQSIEIDAGFVTGPMPVVLEIPGPLEAAMELVP